MISQRSEEGPDSRPLRGKSCDAAVQVQCSEARHQSVNPDQARLAVEIAAKIHQANLPGMDDQRAEICIINPYAGQVEELRNATRRLSDAEICKERVSIRTQTSATGGEWDVVMNAFVRDESKGVLSDKWRIDIVLTRAKLLGIDTLDAAFFLP